MAWRGLALDQIGAACLRTTSIPKKLIATEIIGAMTSWSSTASKTSSQDSCQNRQTSRGSFPCQDLSLAGDYLGLAGERSSTFWPFWRLMRRLAQNGRAPRAIVLENVYGALTSHGGQDFKTIAKAISGVGYRLGAVVIDARLFVPQSRPRLFIIAVQADLPVPAGHVVLDQTVIWHCALSVTLTAIYQKRRVPRWIWWSPPVPAVRNQNFVDLIESAPKGVNWHTQEETAYIVSLMSPVNRRKLDKAIEHTKAKGGSMVGGIYRRTREGQQRAEVRFDDVAGCLRTPAGGSSRQTIILVENGELRKSPLIPPRRRSAYGSS